MYDATDLPEEGRGAQLKLLQIPALPNVIYRRPQGGRQLHLVTQQVIQRQVLFSMRINAFSR